MNDYSKHPTPSSQLSNAKRALLQARLQGRISEKVKSKKIPKRVEQANNQLSFAQQRIWFLQQMAPESGTYNMPAALRLEGALNITALKKAFSEIVRRHEILRTTFSMINNELTQVIFPSRQLFLSITDLKTIPSLDQEDHVLELSNIEAQQPFNLEEGPLLRIRLLQLNENKYVLFVTLHHIISDAWSMNVLIQEMTSLYEAYCGERSITLPELPIQYADFSQWQRNRLQGDVLKQQLNYWTKQLENLPVLDFPTDYPRSEHTDHNGASVQINFSQRFTDSLKILSKEAGVTLFTTLLSGFYILLHRYTGQDDLVTGTVVANRNHPEIEGLIGFFVNSLVLRINLSQRQTFNEFLGHVNEMLVSSYAHQDLPFDKLVEELNINRDSTRNPLFQVGIAFNNISQQPVELAGIKMTPLEHASDTTQFDFTFHFSEEPGHLVGNLVYNTNLFAKSTMERLSEHFKSLMEAVVKKPATFISELPMLDYQEQSRLLTEWQGNIVNFPQEKCLHQLIEEQAIQRPKAKAVVCGDAQLNYETLNSKASQLANYLHTLEIGPGSLVGICMERSVDLIVAIFGVLKAGAAYVPIDPNYPQERKEYLLTDSAARIVLTQAQFVDDSLHNKNVDIVCLDRDWPMIEKCALHEPDTRVKSTNLAYLIYTSGSTGKPKGVMVTHRNAVHSNWARFEHYETPVKSFLLLSSFAFDSSVAGIFWTLSQGGCLCLPEEGAHRDPVHLAWEIIQNKISHILCLPSFYKLLLEHDSLKLSSLNTVIVAGEACPAGLVSQHYGVLPAVALFNEYGPTEGTVWSSVYRLRPEDTQRVIPIGRPINNVEIYLLDASLNPVAIGVKGELYIAGMGLAQGYLNQPKQTAERFIPHPFGHEGMRLYSTGDLARYRTDGKIEFLGRTDDQIKLRGFRIELGEIEMVLLQHPQIKEAAVVIKKYNAGDHRLLAFCVACNFEQENMDDKNVTRNDASLRSLLKVTLPDYMMPSTFIFLDTLPLTPNGKVDRNDLLSRDVPQSQTRQYIAPRNSTEKTLIQIWSETLDVEQISIHDNFFEIGGHSILAAQLILKINNAFKHNIELRVIFDRPTVALLADLIEQGEIPDTKHEMNVIDLAKEATLDPEIRPAGKLMANQDSPGKIFLTGATGFLGAFLLHELLQQTSAEIYCLVRASSDTAASNKLIHNLKRYGIYKPDLINKVIPVCGDLSDAQLGLSSEQFESLARRMDTIYHNAALVNFTQPYVALKAANVDGTQEVLRLACREKTKPVHYVSTLSVFGDDLPADHCGFTEDDPLDSKIKLSDGYSQSKWVAEQLVNIAASRGLPVSIYRLATVTGHSNTGVWNTDDFLCRMIRGCIDLGEAPARQINFNIVPVDYASKAIVNLSRKPHVIGKAFHVSNKRSVSSANLVEWVNALGYSVQQQSYAKWREKVVIKAGQSTHHPLYPLLSTFPPDTMEEDFTFDAREQYSCTKTEQALIGSGIQCPSVDRALLKTYLSYLQKNNFLT